MTVNFIFRSHLGSIFGALLAPLPIRYLSFFPVVEPCLCNSFDLGCSDPGIGAPRRDDGRGGPDLRCAEREAQGLHRVEEDGHAEASTAGLAGGPR